MIEGVALNEVVVNGVFAVLFVWLLRTTQANADKREERLMCHIEMYDKSLAKIANTLDVLDNRLKDIENTLNKV